jgi:hypothetical protein
MNSPFRLGAVLGHCVLSGIALFASAGPAVGGAVFDYGQIPPENIISARIDIDVASMVAHRYIGGTEMNFFKLLDLRGASDPFLDPLDLSYQLFGDSHWPAIPSINQGALETGWIGADIPQVWFPVIGRDHVGIWALLTDTDDAMFAIDFISLTIHTTTGVVTAYYGWPVGGENNGFGIGLPDFGNLPERRCHGHGFRRDHQQQVYDSGTGVVAPVRTPARDSDSSRRPRTTAIARPPNVELCSGDGMPSADGAGACERRVAWFRSSGDPGGVHVRRLVGQPAAGGFLRAWIGPL